MREFCDKFPYIHWPKYCHFIPLCRRLKSTPVQMANALITGVQKWSPHEEGSKGQPTETLKKSPTETTNSEWKCQRRANKSMANCQHCVSVIIIPAKLVNNKPKQDRRKRLRTGRRGATNVAELETPMRTEINRVELWSSVRTGHLNWWWRSRKIYLHSPVPSAMK